MSDPTIREFAEELVSIGTGLSAGHSVGGKISDLARGILRALDEAERKNKPVRREVGEFIHYDARWHRIVPDPEAGA